MGEVCVCSRVCSKVCSKLCSKVWSKVNGTVLRRRWVTCEYVECVVKCAVKC
jgi:hypothetical protein